MGLKNALLLAVTAVPLALTAAVEDRGYASAPVCVVGAGPSGLTAAKALEDKGKKVVVFEKRTDVGGKCQSYYKDGKYYPLGAVLFTNSPGYAASFDLVKKTGVPYEFFDSTEDYVYDPTTGATQLSPTSPEVILQLQAELTRYTVLWQSLASTFAVPAYQNGVPPELAVPARDWLIANNLTAIAAVLNRVWADYGYGPFTEVPALYYLRSAQPDILGSVLGVVDSFTVDFHEVFTRVAKTIKGPIHLGTKIKSIDRCKKRPSISYSIGHGKVHKQQCSDVIIAFPPTASALSRAKLQLSAEEKKLFSKVTTNGYFASAVEMDHLSPNVSLRHVLPNPITPYATEGQPVYLTRIHDDTDILSVWSVDQPGQPDSVEVAQEFLPEVLSKLNKDLSDPDAAGSRVTNRDVLAFSGQVDYFPHVNTQALLDGWYDQFNEIQGKQHTYYVSGLNQFEFVEYAIRAAGALVDGYF
ncbi:flavin containing amine oxidoreductase domain-containing protein [Sarocladium implicatum]|nr:flavin containing amine oxidoreductase domain-containing protein [Sarocladium implicatum]